MKRLLIIAALLLAAAGEVCAQQGNQSVPSGSLGSGALTQSVAGVFTATQYNGPYSSVVVNNCNPSGEYTGIGQPGVSTDAFDACVAVPVGAATHQINAIFGAVNNSAVTSGGNENAVGGYFSGRSIASNTATWGANTIVGSSNGFTGQKITSLESDINNSSGTDAAFNQVLGTLQDGIDIFSGGTNRPRAGMMISNIGTNNFFQSGLVIRVSSDAQASTSLMYLIPGNNNGNGEIVGRNSTDSSTLWQIQNNGNIFSTAFIINSGGYEQFSENNTGTFGAVAGNELCSGDSTTHTLKCSYNGATNYHPLRLSEAGTCTLSGTPGTCTFSYSLSYAATPLCFVTWNGTGTLTGILKAVPGTSSCVVTSSANDTGVIQVEAIGNPN